MRLSKEDFAARVKTPLSTVNMLVEEEIIHVGDDGLLDPVVAEGEIMAEVQRLKAPYEFERLVRECEKEKGVSYRDAVLEVSKTHHELLRKVRG